MRVILDRVILNRNIEDLEMRRLFTNIFVKHMDALGEFHRNPLGRTTNIIFDEKENVFKVYFENGDWWHYTLDGTWY